MAGHVFVAPIVPRIGNRRDPRFHRVVSHGINQDHLVVQGFESLWSHAVSLVHLYCVGYHLGPYLGKEIKDREAKDMGMINHHLTDMMIDALW